MNIPAALKYVEDQMKLPHNAGDYLMLGVLAGMLKCLSEPSEGTEYRLTIHGHQQIVDRIARLEDINNKRAYMAEKCKPVADEKPYWTDDKLIGAKDAKPSECKHSPISKTDCNVCFPEINGCPECAKKQDTIHALNDKLSMLTEEADMIMIDRKIAVKWLAQADYDCLSEDKKLMKEIRSALKGRE